MDLSFDDMTDDQLRSEVQTWAGRVAAGQAVLLRLIGELDAREAWAEQGLLSCAHWVSWRLGVDLVTAREKVRVARALRSLPLISAAFGQGRLSYTQVRAITRVAAAGDEQRWIDLARRSTIEKLQHALRGVDRSRRNEQRESDPEAVAWQDQVRERWDEHGNLKITFTIGPEHAPAVQAALKEARDLEQAERDARLADVAAELAREGASAEAPVGGDASAEVPEGGDAPAEAPGGQDASVEAPEPYEFVEPPYPVTDFSQPTTPAQEEQITTYWAEVNRRRERAAAWQAYQDQLQQQAAAARIPTGRATLTDGLIRVLTRPAGKAPKVTLLVDPVSGWARTPADELLPPSTVDKLLHQLPNRPDLPPVRPLTPADLTRHDLGRSSRVVSPALRTLLANLDGERCRMPGCTRRSKLHAHHVLFWSCGGPTDLSNLVLVCSRHHTLIHQHGYQLTLHPDRTLTVRTADGTLVPHHPALPWQPAEDLDPTGTIGPDRLPTQWTGERMDLGYVVNVMTQHAA